MRKGRKPIGVAYYPAKYKKYKDALESLVRRSLPKDYSPFKRRRLIVRMLVVCTKPRTSKLDDPMPDVDNYAKGIMDACNGAVWDDDRYVKRLVVQKEWGTKGRVDMEVDLFAST